MKTIRTSLCCALFATMAAGCSTDHISVQEEKNEQYVREFVTTFGVPDPDHNYAMAKSAGLTVTSKNGGHVTVTAEVGGTEYLFADLDVAAGTTELPVTIPASVQTLKIMTDKGMKEVSLDSTVDIDAPLPQSRTGRYEVDDKSNDTEMFYVDTEEGRWPYLAFKPSEFLNEYFTKNPANQDNTSHDAEFKPSNRKYPLYDDNGKALPMFVLDKSSHETTFACNNSSKGHTFYIFPIYWQRDRNGNKDYKTILHKVYAGEANLKSPWEPPFGSTEADKPFPYLGYSTTINSRTEIDLNKLDEQFVFDDGNFDKAFDPSEASMVISRGIKVTMYPPQSATDTYRSSFAIAVESNFDGSGKYTSFSSSSPFYNGPQWGQNYYESSLNEAYLALAAAKGMFLDTKNIAYINDGEDYSNLVQGGANYNRWAPMYKEGDFFGRPSALARIVGFSSAACRPADTTPRDYRDVMFLVAPHADNSTAYRYLYSDLPTPFTWTIAAEDLGGSFDWDFNDAVFAFTDVIRNLKTEHIVNSVAMVSGPMNPQAVRIISVTPKAAGGTMPIYLTYTGKIKHTPDWILTNSQRADAINTYLKKMAPLLKASDITLYGDKKLSEANAELKATLESAGEEGTFIIGCELHKWLGASTHEKQFNVGNTREKLAPQTVQFVIPTNLDVSDENLLGYHEGLLAASTNNKPLFGFSVLVDKENSLNINTFNDTDRGFRHIPNLMLGKDNYLIGAPSDKKELTAPQMILVEGDWEWPAECVNIKEAYPSFAGWVNDRTSNPDWHNNKNASKVTAK